VGVKEKLRTLYRCAGRRLKPAATSRCLWQPNL